MNKFLFLAALISAMVYSSTSQAQLVANSLAELRTYGLTANNSTVTLSSTGGDPHPVTGIVTPGEYWINGDHIADPTNSMPIFMNLSGTGNTYDLSGATINLDTRKLDGFGRNLGHDSGVDIIQINGSFNTVLGLTLIGQDIALDTDPNAQRFADWATQYVELSGDNNTVDGANVVTRGSRTDSYGLSDAFGKGASQGISPFISHRKASAFRVGEATNAVVNDMHLDVNTFGHGFFVQASTNTTLTNSTVTGEMFSSQAVVDHELYQEYGHTWWGEPIPSDIMLAGPEGGVRVYTGASGLTVDNVVVTNMRTGFATVHDGGDVNISNSYAYGTTSGFDVGDNTTINNSGGSIENGPLLVFYGSGNNTSIDLELTGGTPVGTDWTAAYFNGNADISITSGLAEGDLPEASYVRLGQSYFENWRDYDYNTASPEDGSPTAYNNNTFENNTNQILVIGENATGNVGSSLAPVISNGKENYYDGVTIVPSGTTTLVSHAKGLGNSGLEEGAEFSGSNIIYTGTPTEATFDTNGTIVENGGTLEISPDLKIIDERVTITGNGVEGVGAIYSDGTPDNQTRLVASNNSTESIVVLDGNASIGVGIENNYLLVSRIAGTGNFTKQGAGILSIEKSSTFDGSFTVAEGGVVARTGVIIDTLTVNAGASIGAIGGNAFNTSETVFIYGDLDMNSRSDDNTIAGMFGTLFGSGSIVASNPEVTGNNELTLATQSFGYYLGSVEDNVNLIKEGVGTQVLAGSSTYTGTTTVNEGFLLIDGTHTGGDDYFINEGGTLGGFGTIGSEVIITSGGVLSPGASAGILTVEAADFQSGSTFEIEIGGTTVGTQFDQLSAADLALGGTLEVSFLNAFTPDANDVFTIATSSNLSGEFENVADGERIQTAGGEGSFLVTYNSSSDTVILSSFLVDTGLLEGDFNRDGTVDAADYTVWRDSFGATGLTPYNGADADGDGQITQLDYNLWVANYGATSSASTSTAVPEPTSMVLMIMVLAARACKARR